jgi:hypothetical protein
MEYNQDSSVGIARGYGLKGRGVISGGSLRFFSTPQHQDKLWGPHNLLYDRYLQDNIKCKKNGFPNYLIKHHSMKRGSRDIAPSLFTSALDWGGWSASSSCRFTARKRTLIPMDNRLGGPHSLSRHDGEEKILLAPRGIEPHFLGRLAELAR